MLRFLLCFCLTAAVAVHAQTTFQGGGGGNDGDDNLFQRLNSDFQKNRQRLNIPTSDKNFLQDVEREKKNIDNNPRNLVSKAAAAICPICQEMLYRHGDPNFRCIPKDSDGKPMLQAEITWKTVQCPVCQSKFLGAMPGNANNKNGLDRDFCQHSIGKACVHSSVWTCPDCGYAAVIGAFGLNWERKPIDEDTAAFVRKEVSPVMFSRMCKLAGIKEESIQKYDAHGFKYFSKYLQQDDLQQDQVPDWIKYDNAIKIYKHQKAPAALMAPLYMEAAHACRREMNGEIVVPGLHATLEESLSLALRRIQHDLTAASIQIRQDRKETSKIDPNKVDTDPQVLCEAAELIMRMGEFNNGDRLLSRSRVSDERTDSRKFYMTGDMFVLCLRYAGFLDRIGRFEDADMALNKAKRFIPQDYGTDNAEIDSDTQAFLSKQLSLLRQCVVDRKKCLEFERECVNRAMWELLVAVHQKQVHFVDPNNLLAPEKKDELDPVWAAYMLGERARRCGEPGAGFAFLAATEAVVDQQFIEMDKELKLAALKKDSPEFQKAAIERSKKLTNDWNMLRQWSIEQRALIVKGAGGKIDNEMKQVLDQVLQAAGIDPAKFKLPAPPIPGAKEAAATEANKAKAALTAMEPVAPDPANAATISTRQDLYKMYYAAIVRYVKDKKSNPPNLTAIVEAGYIAQDNSFLSEKGDCLICPETKEMLLYSRSFILGDATREVLYPKNVLKSNILFGNGAIHLFMQKK